MRWLLLTLLLLGITVPAARAAQWHCLYPVNGEMDGD